MDKHDRKAYASRREVERDRIVDAIVSQLPRRPKGEVPAIRTIMTTAHKLLKDYDLREPGDHSSTAESVEAVFVAAASRLDNLLAQNEES